MVNKTFVEKMREFGLDIKAYLNDSEGEDLENNLFNLAYFLEQEWKARGLDSSISFQEEIDYGQGKYNRIKAVKVFYIDGEYFEITIADLECKWGKVADSERDLNQTLESFFRRVNKKFSILQKNLRQSQSVNPSNRYHL